ncbi:MAG: chemotaxis protein MotB [Candidatus Dadabacteria bacterium]|nr:MAG: chemotaxis protein MotB [Candidatus Dadabacteria bacterium]
MSNQTPGSEEAKRPIIKKVVKKKAGHHGGAWKVAYADFVTAMMALFMVLWIMGQSPEVKNNIAAYFTDPRGVPVIQNSSLLLNNMGAGVFQGMPRPNQMSHTKGKGTGDQFARSLSQMDPELFKAVRDLLKHLRKDAKLREIAKMIKIRVSEEGVRIELSDRADRTFFASASATPTPELERAVDTVFAAVADLDRPIAIEGHTDSVPFAAGSGTNNWDLSSARAQTVREMLLARGLPEQRIREIRAYADRRPLLPNDPKDPRNRRVSILLGTLAPEPGAG